MPEREKGSWGGARKGAGRKPKNDGDPRTYRLTLMVTRSDLDDLRRLAAERATSVASYAYEILRAALVRRRRQIPATKKEKGE